MSQEETVCLEIFSKKQPPVTVVAGKDRMLAEPHYLNISPGINNSMFRVPQRLTFLTLHEDN